MTGVLRTAADEIANYLRDLLAGWNRFWFKPADPIVLSLIRVCAGAMLFYTHLVWTFDLEAFFGPGGWMPYDVVAADPQIAGGRTTFAARYWSHFWLFESPTLLWTAHFAALGVFAMLTLGIASRVTAVLAYLLAVAYVHRAPAAFFGLDKVNCMLAMYLMLGPCGAYFSIDRWWRNRRWRKIDQQAEQARAGQAKGEQGRGGRPAIAPSVGANVAIRLIQVHLCIIYLFSGLDKLQGISWWDGTAVWQAIANLEYQSLDLTWLAGWPHLVAAMTLAAVFWEIFYCVLVWNPRARPLVLAMAVLVHGGIALAMGMITFGLVMLIANLAFVPPGVVRKFDQRRVIGGE